MKNRKKEECASVTAFLFERILEKVDHAFGIDIGCDRRNRHRVVSQALEEILGLFERVPLLQNVNDAAKIHALLVAGIVGSIW